MLYRKIFKWLLAVLFIVGLITSAFGFFNEWPDSKKWKSDQQVASELPEVVADLKSAGAQEFTKSELAEKKDTADKLSAKNEEYVKELEALQAKIDDKKTKKAVKAELQVQYDSLAQVVLDNNAFINKYNLDQQLFNNQTELNEVEERIASGNASVNTILYSTYAMIAIAFVALFVVIFVITGLNSPLGLVKILGGMLVIALLIFGAYKLAPGSALNPESYYHEIGAAVPSAGDLKLTDTILYLAYLLVGGTVLALLISWVVGAIRK